MAETQIVPANIPSLDINPDKYSIENLQSMREAFVGVDDTTLVKYLLARNNNIDKAKELLARVTAWKVQHWPVLRSQLPNELSCGKLYQRGVDKDGRPILLWRSRCNNPKERDIEECGRLLIWWTEYMLRTMPADKTKFVILVDRTNQTQGDMELLKYTANRFQDAFPETMARCIIYPSDFIFYTLWNIGKWFIDPVTRDKVQPMMQLVGVEQFIDRAHIPVSMGGDDDYEYDPEHFQEYLSEEEIAEAKEKEGKATSNIFDK